MFRILLRPARSEGAIRSCTVALSRSRTAFAAFLCSLLFALPAFATLDVPAGTVSSTGGGAFDLACSDLLVAGTLNLDGGQIINVRHVNIQPGGVVNGNTGLISLYGNWSNGGSFTAGNSTINFADNAACTTGSAVSGNTTFRTVNFISAIGKTYTFAAGSTQYVTGVLSISGTSALPINFVSSVPGQLAYIDLSGVQLIGGVAVDWVGAAGQWLAPGATNRNANGVAPRWFGQGEPVPILNGALLVLLTLFMLLAGARLRRKPRVT